MPSADDPGRISIASGYAGNDYCHAERRFIVVRRRNDTNLRVFAEEITGNITTLALPIPDQVHANQFAYWLKTPISTNTSIDVTSSAYRRRRRHRAGQLKFAEWLCHLSDQA